MGKKVEDNGPFAWTGVGAEVTGWLIEDVVNFFLLGFDFFAVDDDLVAFPAHEGLGDFDCDPVDLNAALKNNFFSGSS